MKDYYNSQKFLGIPPGEFRDLSYEYLGKDKTYQEDVYPLCEFEKKSLQKATEKSAEAMASRLGAVAFKSEEFTNEGGTFGDTWYLRFPTGLILNAGMVGNLYWNNAVEHYRHLVDNWNLKGRTGRAAGTDPEQQNPVKNTIMRIANS